MDSFEIIKIQCSCFEAAEFECHCKAQIQYLCSNCASSHIREPNLPHNLKTLTININESSRSALISFIKDSLINLDITKKSISAKLHKLFLELQDQAKVAFKDISILRRNLKSLLKTLSNFPQNTYEWNIKRILAQDLQETIKDLSSWNLFSVNFIIESFETPWIIFDNNYDKCITTKKVEHRPREKSLIIEKPPVLSVERYKSCAIENKEIFEEFKNIQRIIGKKEIEPGLYCEKNHKLFWSYTVILENYLIRGNSKLECKFCGKVFAKPCWHCSQCAFDVCEECGNKQDIKSPKFVCDNNHELLWKCTVAEKYRNSTGIASWKCNFCELSKSTPSWHCSECKFDLCSNCASAYNVFPIELKDKCILNHSLIKVAFKSPTRCKDCSRALTGIGYSCNTCNYHICGNCYKYHNLDIPQDPILICFKGHLLRWNSQRSFLCNSCSRSMKSSFCCMSCLFDYCYQCADYLESIRRNDFIRKDDSGHVLGIKYLVKSELARAFCCKNCNMELPSRCLVFSCEICGYYICIWCFRSDRII
ncbi:hypothetical protein SteCoe_28495 [Stentor coeruleus]|uniref:Phorbol-ester/DAG-type domain-containing protein n=1 Tax=Stentor coeruleus TaxID=5963 RepID=A0A1R2B826_9CILI|nr:hypothetical protein SteCoe_28495 [Stentor coeruleus]